MANILANLHTAFSKAGASPEKYLISTPSGDESNSNPFGLSSKKEIRLNTIFQRTTEILQRFKSDDPSITPTSATGVDQQITLIGQLQADGTKLYTRYENSIKNPRFSRRVCKLFQTWAPDFLKRYFPSIFCAISRAESETNAQHTAYQNCLNDIQTKLQRKKAEFQRPGGGPPPPPSPGTTVNGERPNNGNGDADQNQNRPNPDQKRPDPGPDTPPPPPREEPPKTPERPNTGRPPGTPPLKTPKRPSQLNLLPRIEEVDETATPTPISPRLTRPRSTSEQIDPPGPLTRVFQMKPVANPAPAVDREELINERIAQLNLQNKFDALMLATSKGQFIRQLKAIVQDIQYIVNSLDSDKATDILNTIHLGDKELSEEFITRLKSNATIAALDQGDILEVLQGTPLEELSTRLNNVPLARIDVKRIPGSPAGSPPGYSYVDLRTNTPQHESHFNNFTGTLLLPPDKVENLRNITNTHPTCRPTTIIIPFPEETPLSTEETPQTPLSVEWARMLIALNQGNPTVTTIRLENITSINIEEMGLTADEEKEFLKVLSKLDCPKLGDFSLSNHPKTDWQVEDFQTVLAFHPTFPMLKHCFTRIADPTKIVLPSALLNKPGLYLDGYSIEIMTYLIARFAAVKTLTILSPLVADAHIEQWKKDHLLNSLERLTVKNSTLLSTDIVIPLAELPRLCQVALPELQAGAIEPKDLPSLDNPFKVALLYTLSPILHPFARKAYRGPSAWASVFQIPLALAGSKQLFCVLDAVLDPHSVNRWLTNNNYARLKAAAGEDIQNSSQRHVKTILADHSTLLNDDNVVDFVLTFPGATELSFYNCPNLTDVGFQRLLDALGRTEVRSIDLTGCPQITSSVIALAGNKAKIQRLTTLEVSNTRVSNDLIPGDLKTIVKCLPLTLRITNEQITSDEALEALLSGQDLREYTTLSFEGCTQLTTVALNKVLARLNIESSNRQRLNISTLDLRGCTQIHDEAFNDGPPAQPGVRQNLLILNTLCQIIKKGTPLTDICFGSHPLVSFHDEPTLLRLDTSAVQERIQQQLDGQTVAGPFDPYSEENGNLRVIFNNDAATNPEISRLQLHRDVLYSYSRFFRKKLRHGGELYNGSKTSEITLINQNATQTTVTALRNLIYGTASFLAMSGRDLITVGHMAELAKEESLGLPHNIYHRMLQHLREKFAWVIADSMLVRFKSLNYPQGRDAWENHLIAHVNAHQDNSTVTGTSGIATTHELTRLKETLSEIQKAKALEEERIRQVAEDEAVAKMMAEIENQSGPENDEDLARRMQAAEAAGAARAAGRGGPAGAPRAAPGRGRGGAPAPAGRGGRPEGDVSEKRPGESDEDYIRRLQTTEWGN